MHTKTETHTQDERIEKMEHKIGGVDAKLDNMNDKHQDELQSLNARLKKLEDTVTPPENLPLTVDNMLEVIEERTNRQLRETLVFKNILEIDNEKWEDACRYHIKKHRHNQLRG